MATRRGTGKDMHKGKSVEASKPRDVSARTTNRAANLQRSRSRSRSQTDISAA